MITSGSGSSSEGSKRLTEVILRGAQSDAARIARELANERSEANEVVDTISETMNIVSDLHEVERYTPEQVADCERAAEKALDAIRPRIRLDPRRIDGKVMVTSLRGDPHSFDKTLLLTMLEIGGISAMDGGEELSPEDVIRKISLAKPDVLAVSLVTSTAAQGLLHAKSKLDNSGINVAIVAYGRGTTNIPAQTSLIAREKDSLSALSKIAEILLTR